MAEDFLKEVDPSQSNVTSNQDDGDCVNEVITLASVMN